MYAGPDRRRRRTQDKKLASTRFLASRLMRLGVRALVLGSSDGLLIAYAGQGVDPGAAAAFAPFIAHERWAYPDPVAGSYFVHPIPLEMATLYLFAVGAPNSVCIGRNGISAGIRRIMHE